MRWKHAEIDPPRHQRPVLVWDGNEGFPGFAVARYLGVDGWEADDTILNAENCYGGCVIEMDGGPAWWQDIPDFNFDG